MSNSSSSSEANFERPPAKEDKVFQDTEESQVTDSKSADERSVYSLEWLFEESPTEEPCCSSDCRDAEGEVICQKLANALGESSFNVPKT